LRSYHFGVSIASPSTARPVLPVALEQTRVVAILRHTAAELAIETASALLAGGVPVVEVTLNSAGALGMLGAIRAALKGQIVLGAGTVLDIAAADAAIDGGAEFIVTPHTDTALIRHVVARGTPCLPGAFTASEVFAAWSAGASVVKLFPSGPVGPGYLKDLRGPLGHVPLLPTGGVSLDNAEAFIRAGAWGLGVGGALVDPALVAERRFDELSRRAQAFALIGAQAAVTGSVTPDPRSVTRSVRSTSQ
jgi:2-dehydro-3-deoxyphosphogluconate aldolase/(4S)-4-hydroxy-2-oxoglutarate aldolase